MFVQLVKSMYARYFVGYQGMKFPPFEQSLAKNIRNTSDPVRYESIALAIASVDRERIPGAFAEVGVWRGDTSRLIHLQAPHRMLHLFDTFNGFPSCDLENAKPADAVRFRETSVAAVKSRLGNTDNVAFHVGRFPDTAAGLEHEMFSLVLLDLDIYEPTLAALDFFYPRVSRGGYCFIHDYNSPESDYAMKRATMSFFGDKPEMLIEVPDIWGSVMFRKMS
jgi:O-methyltransferase